MTEQFLTLASIAVAATSTIVDYIYEPQKE